MCCVLNAKVRGYILVIKSTFLLVNILGDFVLEKNNSDIFEISYHITEIRYDFLEFNLKQ